MKPTVPERLILLWGLVGVTGLLAQALTRLSPIAVEPWLTGSLDAWQVALYISWVVLNAYAEGYRAFQLRFCPRVVSRAFFVAREGRWWEKLLAPLFCMSFFSASRRGLALAWGLVICIVALVVLVHQLGQPWRGIVDGGVVVGLAWGAIFLWVQLGRWWHEGAPLPTDLAPDRLAQSNI